MQLKIVTSLDDLIKVFIVRGIVFMEEQGVGYAIEIDAEEHSALHILGELGGEPIASARLRFQGEYAKIERLAVRKQWRGKGYGNQLLDFAITTARHQGLQKFKLHAQTAAQAFYTKHGFEAAGDMFLEADIEHRLMIKDG